MRDALTGCGLDEAVTFSLVADELAAPLERDATTSKTETKSPPLPPLRVEHSSRRREAALRQGLVPSLLAVRRHNEAHGNADAELFEIANVYRPRAGQLLPDEPTHLGLVSGRDFFGLKGVVELILDRLHVADAFEVKPVDLESFTTGQSAALYLGGEPLGHLGEVAASWRDALELRGPCTAAELDLGVLARHAVLVPSYRALPPFPAVARDLSLVVPRSLAWSDLAATVRPAAGRLLESIDFLDTFEGGSVPAGKQSLHFGLRFRHSERTLTGEEVEAAVQSIVSACAERFAATLRT